MQVRPNKYTAGQYLIVTPRSDTAYQYVFETDKGRVTTFRGGRVPQVRYVEGCAWTPSIVGR